MHSILSLLGIEAWKPVLTALLLPPVPLLLMVLVGARLIRPRCGWGWFIVVASVAGLWLTACSGVARFVEPLLLTASPPLRADRLAELKAAAAADGSKGTLAIVVLGGGVEPYAPEYGTSNLSSNSLERLRYGVWLSRETGWPVAFTGGVGWANQGGATEAEVAERIASQEYGRPLRWTESASRDTRENARHTVPMLRAAGVQHILLVTRGWHMQRAKALFEEAAAGSGIRIEAAPMGLATHNEVPALAWLPSSGGQSRLRLVLHEWIGWKLGT